MGAGPAAAAELWGGWPWWLATQPQVLKQYPVQRVLFQSWELQPDATLDPHRWADLWQTPASTAKQATKQSTKEFAKGVSTNPPTKSASLLASPIASQLRANRQRIAPVLLVRDAALFNHLFASRPRWMLVLARTLAELNGVPADVLAGLHLDLPLYVNLNTEAIQGFHVFVAELRQRLLEKYPKAQLSALAPAGVEQALWDASTIAHLDFLVLNGHEAHWLDGPEAGSLAPLKGAGFITWENTLRYYTKLGWPTHKILFSLPLYGVEWPTQNEKLSSGTRAEGQILSFTPLLASKNNPYPIAARSVQQQISQYPVRRDAESGSSWYVYRTRQGWMQGWFEDESSLQQKIDFIQRERLAGVSLQFLGADGGQFKALVQPLLQSANKPAIKSLSKANGSGKKN